MQIAIKIADSSPRKRDCIGTGTGYAPGDHEVTDLKLRSVVCYESDAKAAKDGKNLDL